MVMLKNLDLDAKDFGFLQSVLLLWSGSAAAALPLSLSFDSPVRTSRAD
jgi:hypothetical protein